MWDRFFFWFSSGFVSAIIILHHSKKECAKTRPGVIAVLLCKLLVIVLTGFDCSGCRRWSMSLRSLLLCITKSEMSISCCSSAHTCPDQLTTVLAQILLLLQCSCNLLPVKFDVGGISGTDSWFGNIIAAEAPVPLLAGNTKDEAILTCCSPGTVRLVFGDQFAFNGLSWDRLMLAAHLQPCPVLVLSSVHSSPPPSITLLTAAQHQLMRNTSQNQQDGDIGEESHETNTKDPARG